MQQEIMVWLFIDKKGNRIPVGCTEAEVAGWYEKGYALDPDSDTNEASRRVKEAYAIKTSGNAKGKSGLEQPTDGNG